jgi:glycosyltransferase involved in cell wall biosynthesis
VRELVPALAREFPALRLTLVTSRNGERALRGDGFAEFAEIVSLPCDEYQRGRRQLAEQVLLPRLARRRGWDVLHSLGSIAPIRAAVPSVITIHDVTFVRLRTFSRVTTFGMYQVVARSARRADVLITDSRASRDEICSTLGLDPGRFVIVHLGPGRRPSVHPASEQAVRARYRLHAGPLVLCVAAKRPHKNQGLLVRALPDLPPDAVVLLAGRPEPYDAELRTHAAELGVADRMRFADYVPDDELERLWQLADCAAFPTLGEGFGLPVLEAMQRGVPVACSDLPVLRELGGDVPHYFDPHDPVAAATAIRAACEDETASAAGRERAMAFSWEDAARATFEAYERALAQSDR